VGPQCFRGTIGSRDWDAGCGDDRQDPARVFRPEEGDQGDLPGAEGFAEDRAAGGARRGDGVRLRAEGAAAAEDRAVARGARPAAGGECGAGEPGAADADPGLRGAARARLRGRLRRGAAVRGRLAARAGRGDGGGVRAAELRAGRGLPVRLEPRGGADRRGHGDGEGGAGPALPQPDAVRAGLSARDAGDGVRRPRPGLRLLPGRLHAGHLRQHEDGGGRDPGRQGAGLQPALPADVRALPGRAGGVHPGLGLGEGPGREPGRHGAAALLLAAGGSGATTS
jgi:hypothetical protein